MDSYFSSIHLKMEVFELFVKLNHVGVFFTFEIYFFLKGSTLYFFFIQTFQIFRPNISLKRPFNCLKTKIFRKED